MRRGFIAYLIACAIAAQHQTAAGITLAVTFPGWPSKFNGKTLTPLALNERERSFASNFPVYEQIHADSGETWTDASAWYWSALQHDSGSWWAITVAEKEP